MNTFKRIGRLTAIFLALALYVGAAHAQSSPTLTSANASTNLNLTIAESLTVSAPASVTFTGYNSAAGTASAPVFSVVTTGNLAAGHANIQTFGWLGSATAALSGPASVPSSQIFASINGGTASACNQSGNLGTTYNVPGFVAGAVCSNVGGALGFMITPPAGAFTQTNTVLLTLQGATNLNPGSYTGVIVFQADTF
jgi:hypothetical protein